MALKHAISMISYPSYKSWTAVNIAFLCWCAVKKLLTHSLRHVLQLLLGDYVSLCMAWHTALKAAWLDLRTCCRTGIGQTGVFVALSIVLERMRFEGVVDMFQTVNILRTQRPSMVHTEVRRTYALYRSASLISYTYTEHRQCTGSSAVHQWRNFIPPPPQANDRRSPTPSSIYNSMPRILT